MSNSLQPHGLYSSWNSLGHNTGVGSLSLLQGIFPTQGLNSGFPHCRQILYQLSHYGSPGILEWVTYSFSSRSFQLRNKTRVSCTADRFYTSCATKYNLTKEAAAAAAKLLQSCPTCATPQTAAHQGSPVPGILQARTLEWVAISFSNA